MNGRLQKGAPGRAARSPAIAAVLILFAGARDGRAEAYATDAVGTRRDLYRVHIRPVAITSLDFRRCYNYRNTVESFMIKDEIFAGARQTKPLHLCLCVIKRDRRFLPAERTAIELPKDVERGSHGDNH